MRNIRCHHQAYSELVLECTICVKQSNPLTSLPADVSIGRKPNFKLDRSGCLFATATDGGQMFHEDLTGLIISKAWPTAEFLKAVSVGQMGAA